MPLDSHDIAKSRTTARILLMVIALLVDAAICCCNGTGIREASLHQMPCSQLLLQFRAVLARRLQEGESGPCLAAHECRGTTNSENRGNAPRRGKKRPFQVIEIR